MLRDKFEVNKVLADLLYKGCYKKNMKKLQTFKMLKEMIWKSVDYESCEKESTARNVNLELLGHLLTEI